jgi:HlyD family secretion protein
MTTLQRTSMLPLTAVLLTICGCGAAADGPAENNASAATAGGAAPLVRVTPVKPQRKTLVRRVEQPGRIEAFEETPLFAKVTGYVRRIHVDIGDKVTGPKFDDEGKLVTEGQVLAELSIPELDEELKQKQALVVQAAAEVKQAEAAIKVADSMRTSARARVTEAQAVVDRYQANYDRWKSELARITELADKGAVTIKLVDETTNQFRAADSSRNEAAAKIRSAEAGYAEAEALVEKAHSDLDAAKARQLVAGADEQRAATLLGYATIRAPFDGVVTARNIDTGHLVHAATGTGGKPLFVVVKSDVLRIFVDVPEADAVLTAEQAEVKVRIPSSPGEAFTGKVTRTAWALDTATRTLRAEIDIDNPQGHLRPGMYVTADLKVAERPDALALPKTAIISGDGQTACLTIDAGGIIKKTPLVTCIRAGDDVEIVSGLTGEEQVIGVNPAAFREGQQVEVVEGAKK